MLRHELRQVLQLQPEQVQAMSGLETMNIGKQYTAKCALLRLAMAAESQKWFESSLHEHVCNKFQGIVNTDQDKRYLAWTSRNMDAIRLLRFYRASEAEKVAADHVGQLNKSYLEPISQKKPLFFFGGKGAVY